MEDFDGFSSSSSFAETAKDNPADYIRSNRASSQFPRLKNLECFVKSSYSTPGTDSSRGLRLKKVDGCGKYGATLDIILRSLVNFYLISSFEKDVKVLATGIVAFVHDHIKDSPEVSHSLTNWCNSPVGAKEFLKYIRDKRSEILKNWIQMLTLKPYTILFTSLARFTPLWKKNTNLFDPSPRNLSIFGIYG